MPLSWWEELRVTNFKERLAEIVNHNFGRTLVATEVTDTPRVQKDKIVTGLNEIAASSIADPQQNLQPRKFHRSRPCDVQTLPAPLRRLGLPFSAQT
jgi:hypothetical protein